MGDKIRVWKPETPKRNETPKPKHKPMSDLLWDKCITTQAPIRLTFTDGEQIDAVMVAYDTYHFKRQTGDRVRVAFKHAVKAIDWGNG